MRRVVWLGILGFAGLVGCGTHECQTKNGSSPKSSTGDCPDCCAVADRATMLQSSKSVPSAILKVVSGEQLTQEIESHPGKVVCVFVWGSFHPLSIKQLPGMVELQSKFAKENVVCMTACQAPEQTRPLASKLLANAKCELPNFVIEDDRPDSMLNQLGLPALIVFGRDGKKTATFDMQTKAPEFDLQAIEKAVEQAVQASAETR